jgi:hypothetical protein
MGIWRDSLGDTVLWLVDAEGRVIGVKDRRGREWHIPMAERPAGTAQALLTPRAETAGSAPPGGSAGQVLTKNTAVDGDYTWINPPGATQNSLATPSPTIAPTVDAVNAGLGALKGVPPGALDTLAKLATAIANDANFATTINAAIALRAPSANPTLTGNVNVPTVAPGNNSTLAASTAFVMAAIAGVINSSPAALDTLIELANALGNDQNFATTVTNAIGMKAPIASPQLTGIPEAPTAAPGNSTTQIATTAFVMAAIAAAGGIGGGGSSAYVDAGYVEAGYVS